MNQVAGTNWILVMDADEVSRAKMRSMLEQAGYKACLVGNNDEVIECYKEAQRYGYPFDAVIVALHAPEDQSEKETIRRLIECDPGVKAIATSGAVADSLLTDFKTCGFKSVLTKPFTVGTLEHTMHQVIKSVPINSVHTMNGHG